MASRTRSHSCGESVLGVGAEILLKLPPHRALRVTDLDLERWSADSIDPCLLGSLILRSTSLTSLSLAQNCLDDNAIVSLAACIGIVQENSNGGLLRLNASFNQITAIGCEAIASAFFSQACDSKSGRIYTLVLNNNPHLGDMGVAALGAKLAERGCRAELHLQAVGLTAVGFASLAASAYTLATLDLAYNATSAKESANELRLLCNAIGSSSYLRVLDLSHVLLNAAADKGSAHDNVIESLRTMLKSTECGLSELHLAGMGIDGHAAKLLLDAAAQGGSRLEKLDLASNSIGILGVRTLSNLLLVNEESLVRSVACAPRLGLKVLDLCKNGIDDVAIALLTQGLRENLTLEVLLLASNAISDSGASLLADAMKAQRLRINKEDVIIEDGNPNGPQDVDSAEQHGLLELDLRWNKIGIDGVESLAEAASAAPASLDCPRGPWGLRQLSLTGHCSGKRGEVVLRQAAVARIGLLRLLLQNLSGANAPRRFGGGCSPPQLLRCDVLPAPTPEEKFHEDSLRRGWAEHFQHDGPSSDKVVTWSLSDEIREYASEMEDVRRERAQTAPPVYMTHLPMNELDDPEEEETKPRANSSWLPSWLGGESTPERDGLDDFWDSDT